MELRGTRNAGTDNDSYFDDLFLKVGTQVEDCFDISSSYEHQSFYTKQLKIFPIPALNSVSIIIPESLRGAFSFNLISNEGVKVESIFEKTEDSIIIDLTNLPVGFYSVLLRDKHGSVYSGRILKDQQ